MLYPTKSIQYLYGMNRSKSQSFLIVLHPTKSIQYLYGMHRDYDLLVT